jgi:adenine/guanine phosphoribosyltransferase-like PRPP-binding protein
MIYAGALFFTCFLFLKIISSERGKQMSMDDYIEELLDPEHLDRIVREIITRLERENIEFDSIAFRGMSGALVSPSVATCLKKNLIIVRKGETTHAVDRVNYHRIKAPKRFIIIDDFVSSGDTLREILKKVFDKFENSVCVCIILYNSSHNRESSVKYMIREFEKSKDAMVIIFEIEK